MGSEATLSDPGRWGQTVPGPCASAPRPEGELELEAIARGGEAGELDPEPRRLDATSSGGELDAEAKTRGRAEASWINWGMRNN